MKRDEAIRWIAELQSSCPSKALDARGATPQATNWMVQASALLEVALPAGHAVRREVADGLMARSPTELIVLRFNRLIGLLAATKSLLENDRLESLADTIRVETESEVLDTAFELLSDGHRVAAAVLGGGSLEVHLKRLYERTPNLPPYKNTPSIEKYDNAIATARNAGTPVPYDSTNSKNVKAWAALRNDAAHSPTSFAAPVEQVRQMLDGIRLFIANVR